MGDNSYESKLIIYQIGDGLEPLLNEGGYTL